MQARLGAQKMHGIEAELLTALAAEQRSWAAGASKKTFKSQVSGYALGLRAERRPVTNHFVTAYPRYQLGPGEPAERVRPLPIVVLVRVPHEQADRSPFARCNIALAQAAF